VGRENQPLHGAHAADSHQAGRGGLKQLQARFTAADGWDCNHPGRFPNRELRDASLRGSLLESS